MPVDLERWVAVLARRRGGTPLSVDRAAAALLLGHWLGGALETRKLHMGFQRSAGSETGGGGGASSLLTKSEPISSTVLRSDRSRFRCADVWRW